MNNTFEESYEKMPDSLQKLGLSEGQFAALEKVKWVVTEKVHGANFSFIYENGNLQFAKRKNLLAWNESFFGFQLVASDLEENVMNLFEDLRLHFSSDKFILHGELFGGKYPHPEVKPDENLQPVQTGVYYSPGILFCAFDIAFVSSGSDQKTYLDYKTAAKYFDKHGIFYAKPLFTGKLNEALNFKTRINSAIPEMLGLPAIADNIIEGIVVKPYEAFEYDQIGFRPILKVKNEEFKEEKFHEAQKWDYLPETAFKSQELSFVTDELKSFVNENRLNSAISKVGAPDLNDPQRMAEIEAEILQDCITDFNLATNGLLDLFDDQQKTWIENRLKAEIKLLINDLA